MYLGSKAMALPNGELSDEGAQVRHQYLQRAGIEKFNRVGTLGDLLDHPKLYENYPELKSIPVLAQNVEGDAGLVSASWSAKEHNILIEIPESINESRDGKVLADSVAESLIHEVQHAVQQIEGMPRGSSPGHWHRAALEQLKIGEQRNDPSFIQTITAYQAIFIDAKPKQVAGPLKDVELRAAIREISKVVQTEAFHLYRDDPGEVQARITAAKHVGKLPEEIPSRNVRDLPHAPTAKPGMNERISNIRFALARSTDALKTRFTPAPKGIAQQDAATTQKPATEARTEQTSGKAPLRQAMTPDLESRNKALATVFATYPPQQALRNYPELEPAYEQLAHMRKWSERSGLNPAEQTRLLDRGREQIRDALSQGKEFAAPKEQGRSR